MLSQVIYVIDTPALAVPRIVVIRSRPGIVVVVVTENTSSNLVPCKTGTASGALFPNTTVPIPIGNIAPNIGVKSTNAPATGVKMLLPAAAEYS